MATVLHECGMWKLTVQGREYAWKRLNMPRSATESFEGHGTIREFVAWAKHQGMAPATLDGVMQEVNEYLDRRMLRYADPKLCEGCRYRTRFAAVHGERRKSAWATIIADTAEWRFAVTDKQTLLWYSRSRQQRLSSPIVIHEVSRVPQSIWNDRRVRDCINRLRPGHGRD